jgi:hypothetical protein
MANVIQQLLRRDGGYAPIQDQDGFVQTKTMTFAGGTTNDPGDVDGTGNPATLFTVTGDVILRIIGICKTNLAGATATLEVGLTGNTATLIAQSTATDIDADEIWHDATPDAKVELNSVAGARIISGGQDVIQTVGTANITSGVVEYYCFWRPLSSTGLVESA